MKLVRKFEVSSRKITMISTVKNTCRFGNSKKLVIDSLKGLRLINSFLMDMKPQKSVSIILIDIDISMKHKKAHLAGTVLPFVTTENIPYIDIIVNKNGDYRFKGALWKTAELVAEKLKFTPNRIDQFYFTGYKDENGNYTYGLNHLNSGKAEIDISIQGLSAEKIQDFDYVYAIAGHEAGHITFLTRYPRKGDMLKRFAVFDPFSITAWILIVLATGIMTLFIWFIVSIKNVIYVQTPRHLVRPKHSYLEVGMSILGIVLSRSGLPVPGTSGIRIAVGAWCLTAVIIGSLYTRNFYASAIVPVPIQGPLTAKDLVENDYKYVPKNRPGKRMD